MNKLPGLYIHIPFCKSKCPYCDFYSIVSSSLIDKFLDSIFIEMDFYKSFVKKIDTLYLGGGTPSILNKEQIFKLIKNIKSKFKFTLNPEITIEVNPDSINLEKLKIYKELGINRISVGVQSFNDNELKFLKRIHNVKQSINTLEQIRKVGFDNLNIDLMYGFENQTEKNWENTLKQTMDFKPEHLSCYMMTIEKSTLFGKMLKQKKIKELNEDFQCRLFIKTSEFLQENGYIHYEISNFARPNFLSRHNTKYWNHIQYIGLGPAAHSFKKRKRWWNYKSIYKYCQNLRNNILPVEDFEILTKEQFILEKIYLGFRTKNGVEIKFLKINPKWETILEYLQKNKLVSVINDRVISTIKGFLISDQLPLWFINRV